MRKIGQHYQFVEKLRRTLRIMHEYYGVRWKGVMILRGCSMPLCLASLSFFTIFCVPLPWYYAVVDISLFSYE